jgi:hypothetical protein
VCRRISTNWQGQHRPRSGCLRMMRGFACASLCLAAGAVDMNLLMIYHRPVPSFVTRQWEHTNPGVVVLPYTFPQARVFIENTYNASYVAHFDTLTPMIASDFFRYLYLYENGGAYADVDQDQLATCNFGTEVDFVLSLSPIEGFCANTFLWSRRPRHPLMINAANAMMDRPDIESLAHLYHVARDYTGVARLQAGYSRGVQINQEVCAGLKRCTIFDPTFAVFAFSRYTRYHDGEFERFERNIVVPMHIVRNTTVVFVSAAVLLVLRRWL